MPRTSRVAPGGYVYHVLNRGVGRRNLFDKSADFQAYCSGRRGRRSGGGARGLQFPPAGRVGTPYGFGFAATSGVAAISPWMVPRARQVVLPPMARSVSISMVRSISPGLSPALKVTGTRWTVFESLPVLKAKASSEHLTERILKGFLDRTTSCLVTVVPGSTTPTNRDDGLTVR